MSRTKTNMKTMTKVRVLSEEVLEEGSVTDDKRGKAGGQSQRDKGSINNFPSCNLSKLDFRNCKPGLSLGILFR